MTRCKNAWTMKSEPVLEVAPQQRQREWQRLKVGGQPGGWGVQSDHQPLQECTGQGGEGLGSDTSKSLRPHWLVSRPGRLSQGPGHIFQHGEGGVPASPAGIRGKGHGCQPPACPEHPAQEATG